jgi:hypothetical protein
MIKKNFIIEPHFRLQEWVAEEKGYFRDEGSAARAFDFHAALFLSPDQWR